MLECRTAHSSQLAARAPVLGRYDHSMLTAWSASRAQRRVRAYAGPARLLALAVLVFSLVIAHGVSCGTTDGRPANGTAADAAVSTAAGAVVSVPEGAAHEHGHGHEPPCESEPQHEHEDPHTGGECVSGQPQQGPVLNAPCPAPFTQDAGDARTTGMVEPPTSEPAVIPLAASRRSVVQRI